MNTYSIRCEEKIVFALRSLYGSRGYSRYKMSKFEEYDLYVRNKDFLISDSVITFTDTNGRLMALKPDVTLSIVKNSRDLKGCVQKLYYDENVYRVSKGTRTFKEIKQVGLECIGDIDDYCIMEVLNLAGASLNCISEDWVLNISHLDVLAELLEGVPDEKKSAIFKCISEKNPHELKKACDYAGVNGQCMEKLEMLLHAYGKPREILPKLEESIGDSAALRQLSVICEAMDTGMLADRLRVDFSVVSDVSYYNGIVFKGFVQNVPSAVLSGGQYDRLMCKMNRKSGAIGFAVYMDQLERLNETERKYDVDMILLYGDDANGALLHAAVEEICKAGKSVLVQKEKPEKIRCKCVAGYEGGEVKILEEYA